MRLGDDEDVVIFQRASERQRGIEKQAYRGKERIEPSSGLVRQRSWRWSRSDGRLDHAIVVDGAWKDKGE